MFPVHAQGITQAQKHFAKRTQISLAKTFPASVRGNPCGFHRDRPGGLDSSGAVLLLGVDNTAKVCDIGGTMKNLIHLSLAQRTALLTAIAAFETRPSPEAYSKVADSLAAIPTQPKPKAAKIPNTLPGHEPKDVKLCEGFDAPRDLPEGWAVFSRYDSGANYGIENAAVNVWRNVWNGWREGRPYSLEEKAAIPGGMGEVCRALLAT